jgi:hypothetical protein
MVGKLSMDLLIFEALKILMHFREPGSSLYFYFYTYSFFFFSYFSFFLSFFLFLIIIFFSLFFLSHKIFFAPL